MVFMQKTVCAWGKAIQTKALNYAHIVLQANKNVIVALTVYVHNVVV